MPTATTERPIDHAQAAAPAAAARRGFFLFQTGSAEHPVLFWLWNWFFVLASGAGCGLLSLRLAIGRYPHEIFWSYFDHPSIILLNLLPVMLLTALLYCLIGRAWIAFLAAGVPVFLASAGNYFKLLFRDDPFKFSDVVDIGMALQFTGSYKIEFDTRLWFCVGCIVAGAVFLFFCVRGRPRGKTRLCVVLLLALSILPLSRAYTSADVYDRKTANDTYINPWIATQAYLSRGFVYPFLHSVSEALPSRPAGYSDSAARALLTSYTPENIPDDKKANVIGIQLEAFNDFTRIGFSDIDESVYAAYHQLERESYCGRLVTNIFVGGTVDTERGFLTGDTAVEDFRHDTGSYVRYFKGQGYDTEGGHPCYESFYNRVNVNSYLGFDRYWFYENRYAALANDAMADDAIFLSDLLELYQARDKGTPYFNFSVTYQGHGPYSETKLLWGEECWHGDGVSEETYYILNNYLGSVRDTAAQLSALVDALRAEDDPVVLVVFGDHNPWLGNNNSVYKELGINLDTSTEEGFYQYYGTRYLIWANDAARALLDGDFVGEGPDVSPCFLMNVLFQQCGWGGGDAYMQLAGELMESVPVVNTDGFYVENGVVTRSLSGQTEEQLQRLLIAQFYRKRHVAELY